MVNLNTVETETKLSNGGVVYPPNYPETLKDLVDTAVRYINTIGTLGPLVIYEQDTAFSLKVPELDPKKFNLERQFRKVRSSDGNSYMDIAVIKFNGGGNTALMVLVNDIMRVANDNDLSDFDIISETVAAMYGDDPKTTQVIDYTPSNSHGFKYGVEEAVNRIVLALDIDPVTKAREKNLVGMEKYLRIFNSILVNKFSGANAGIKALLECRIVCRMGKSTNLYMGIELTNPFKDKKTTRLYIVDRDINRGVCMPTIDMAFDNKALLEKAKSEGIDLAIFSADNFERYEHIIDITGIEKLYEVEEMLNKPIDVVVKKYLGCKLDSSFY